MRYVFVLEDEPKLQKQIYEALRKSEPQAQIRYFSSVEDFQKWIAVAIKDGNQALSTGGFRLEIDKEQAPAADPSDELTLLISKDEWLGSRYMSLIRKTQEMLIRRGICTKEDPTRLMLTAFESPDFDIKLVEDRIISNVIFKPFDELMLQQQLHFALQGHHPPSQTFVHTVQTEEEVEMTKEVQMEAVGDIGFVTRSPREIRVGQISKYYGEVFKSTGRIHLMGRCISCEPHADAKDEFRVWFSYFGIPSTQISDIRKNMVKRNEIEYSANTPIKIQQDTKQWIILDPKKERAQKYKKILENVFGAHVEMFNSFESFGFQTDPMAADSARKEKPWLDAPKIKLTFDRRGEKITHIEPQDQEAKKLFGMSWEDFKSKDFGSRLHAISLPEWKSMVANVKVLNTVLLVHAGEHYFPVVVTDIQKNKDAANHEILTVEFEEPQIAFKVDWFNKNFPSPAMVHGILIAEEYLTESKLEFWTAFRDSAQKKNLTPKFFSLHAKAPSEVVTRSLSWVYDIFEESNEAPYVERKLNWMYQRAPVQASGTPYLNSCKEIIRVANPVQVAELSEAAIVINYYRAISVGAFRQFVLSKKEGETFAEYRAVCNYSSEHPSEKDLFQNHFVFFGITDAYLKNLRVWILENYIESKNKDGG